MRELFLIVLNMSLTASYVILFVILVRLLCEALDCQPGDILEYRKGEKDDE